MNRNFNNAMRAVNERIRYYEFKQRINEHLGDANKMVDEPFGNTEQPLNGNLSEITAKGDTHEQTHSNTAQKQGR
jgi:hypothetical protein